MQDEDGVARLAKEGLFEVMDDIDADYENLVQTVFAIANSCRSVASNHSSRRISASTRALLEKRRNMDRQENHIEYTLLSARNERTVLEGTLPFLLSEVRHAIEKMPRGKAPGKDGISMELLQACGPPLYRALARRYTRYLAECTVPMAWKQSSTVLLFKKGDKEDLANYRPITLLPAVYKIFTRCILARIRSTLEEAQPVEQAGFRRNFSTLGHIATCRRLIEVSREQRLSLVMTFIGYKKAFYSVEPVKVWEALEGQGVERIYVDVVRECYSDCTTVLHPFYNDVVVAVQKRVRQGDPISSNLFYACLRHVIRRCNWSNFDVTSTVFVSTICDLKVTSC
ncbi:hypothetical protein V3C99_016329 [Haemonchus contortus]|uniref:Reverse transcriptase domain-containing protein n=1 Tax=Haemonchus contortus TaxID=6289 RepID=A0A7I4YXN2_HAECO